MLGASISARRKKFTPADRDLRRRLFHYKWSREELEWLQQHDTHMPIELAMLVAGKLRQLDQEPLPGIL